MRYHAAALATALTLFTACAEETVAPPPPAVNMAARVVISLYHPLVFTGQHVAWSELVTVTNRDGVELDGWRINATLPPGFTATGDSVFAPATESLGPLHVSATTLPAPAATDPFSDADLRAVEDLTKSQWSATWSCKATPSDTMIFGARYDSVRYSGTVTPSYLYAPPMPSTSETGIARLDWSGNATVWRGGVSESHTLVIAPVYLVRSQWPNRINVIPTTGVFGSYWLERSSAASPEYVQSEPDTAPCNSNDANAAGAPFTMARTGGP